MARREPRLAASYQCILTPQREQCLSCGQLLWVAYHNVRRIMRLDGLYQLTLVVRRCHNPLCERYHVAYRPEEEGAWRVRLRSNSVGQGMAICRASQCARDPPTPRAGRQPGYEGIIKGGSLLKKSN
jgi:hypothetical protein